MSINWLPLSHRKNTSQVKIVYEEPNNQNYGGLYHPGLNTLVIVYNKCIKEEASVISHEFRHHFQYEKGIKFDHIAFDPRVPYEQAIRKFFRSSKTEFDALLYQYKYANSEQTNWWLKELVLDKNLRQRYL